MFHGSPWVRPLPKQLHIKAFSGAHCAPCDVRKFSRFGPRPEVDANADLSTERIVTEGHGNNQHITSQRNEGLNVQFSALGHRMRYFEWMVGLGHTC